MSEEIDKKKRRILLAAAAAMGGVGGAYVATPFILSMDPSAKAEAAGAPVDVDISKLEVGQLMTVEWRGKPVWILRRSEAMLDSMKTLDSDLRDPQSNELTQQPNYTKNPHRSLNPEFMVMIGICTHLGCAPTYRPDLAPADLGAAWKGGFFCPCHGSRYDLAGRVYAGVPAPSNLVVPPYRFVTGTRLLIGVDPEHA
ncbi:MAG: ubiquinol-cytochrome c reductase iron-sulfur subunit [Gammaproteobacteria bacterium]|nr:ubiquinol-cytochrome c reductase iron-sulfur subunit [Gammaproteobacteria bacterium]MDH5803278.1 ubiquinol-cytochrome c reductase iron-sulfur subunit [Gammaproteobacteria bacterium]